MSVSVGGGGGERAKVCDKVTEFPRGQQRAHRRHRTRRAVALRNLGLITGETLIDDLLNQIFATFCIGK